MLRGLVIVPAHALLAPDAEDIGDSVHSGPSELRQELW